MHCIDPRQELMPHPGRRELSRSFAAGWLFVAGASGPLWLAGCGLRQAAPPAATPAPAPVPSGTTRPPASPAPATSPPPPPPPPLPAAQAPPTPGLAGPAGRAPRYVKLGPPTPSRNWEEVRVQAARRLVAAHPDTSYMGQPQPLLLAIPVMEIELNGDGSIRSISVIRQPGQARDTVQLAIDALRRAAPFGDVSRLPKPWKFIETFLFNDDRRFKPRTLDQ